MASSPLPRAILERMRLVMVSVGFAIQESYGWSIGTLYSGVKVTGVQGRTGAEAQLVSGRDAAEAPLFHGAQVEAVKPKAASLRSADGRRRPSLYEQNLPTRAKPFLQGGS